MTSSKKILLLSILSSFLFVAILVFLYLNSRQPQISQQSPPTPTTTPDTIDTSNWQTYNDSINGFSIRYPSDWTSQKSSEKELYTITSSDGHSSVDIINQKTWYNVNTQFTPGTLKATINGQTALVQKTEMSLNYFLVSNKTNQIFQIIIRPPESHLASQILSTFKFIELSPSPTPSAWINLTFNYYDAKIKIPNGWGIINNMLTGEFIPINSDKTFYEGFNLVQIKKNKTDPNLIQIDLSEKSPSAVQKTGSAPEFDEILSSLKFIDTTNSLGWKTYSYPKYGFQVQYPGDWYASDCDFSLGLLLNPEKEIICETEPSEPISFRVDTYTKTVQQYLDNLTHAGFKATLIDKNLPNNASKYLIEKVEELPGPDESIDIIVPINQALFKIWIVDLQQEKVADQILSTFKFTDISDNSLKNDLTAIIKKQQLATSITPTTLTWENIELPGFGFGIVFSENGADDGEKVSPIQSDLISKFKLVKSKNQDPESLASFEYYQGAKVVCIFTSNEERWSANCANLE